MTNETDKSDFPSRLEYLISESGTTKKAFAQNCGIKEKQLYIYLKGESEPGMKALRGIKEYYPQISIDWLITGQGKAFIESWKKSTENVSDLKHGRIVREFEDKDFAMEIDQALLALEKSSQKEFYKLGGYIKALAEHGIELRLQQQEDSDTWDGTERRSGKDRRKAVGGN